MSSKRMEATWRLDAADPLVRQHVVAGRVVVPMAFWLSRSLQDVTAHGAKTPLQLVRVLVRRPVVLEKGVPLDAHFVGMPESGAGRFEVRREGVPAGGVLVEGAWGPDEGGDRREPRPCGGPALSHDAFYEAAERAGLSYGEGLRRVASLSLGDRAWTCELRGDEEEDRVAAWDAMLQGGAVLAAETDGSRWLPFGVDRMRFGEGEPGEPLGRVYGEWSEAPSPRGQRVRVASLLGFGARSGAILVELSGVRYGAGDSADDPIGETPPDAAEALFVPAGPKEILARLRAATPETRRALLTRFIEDQLLEILQWNESKRANLAAGFVVIGVDSLMSVDLQYRLQTALDFALPLGEGLDAASVPDLADSLLEKCLKLD